MYEIMVEAPFSAAHHLDEYRGRCSRVHGHRWRVRLYIRGPETDEQGILVSGTAIGRLLSSLLERFESSDLNRDPLFLRRNPTAENLAAWLYRVIRTAPLITSRTASAHLHAVEVEETPGSIARHSAPQSLDRTV